MFFMDKYKPTTKEEAFFHKQILDLLEVMSKDEALPHIIFYGPAGSGKKTLVAIFLEMIFGKYVNRTKNVQYKVSGSGSKITMESVKQSQHHIVIEPKNNNSDRYIIHDIVKEYARHIGVFQKKRSFKVVLIKKIDNLSYSVQTSLRRTMETFNEKCRFIMWCQSLSKVIKPLQSRCICLRVPTPSDIELLKYIIKISTCENIMLSRQQYFDIVRRSNGDIKRALWELEFFRFNYKIDTDYYESLQKIIDLLLEPKLGNMILIRNIIFNLMITNFEGTVIMRDLIDYICCCKKITDIAKQKIIYESAEIEYQLVKGRREIFHFDAIISSIMTILHDQKGLIVKKN